MTGVAPPPVAPEHHRARRVAKAIARVHRGAAARGRGRRARAGQHAVGQRARAPHSRVAGEPASHGQARGGCAARQPAVGRVAVERRAARQPRSSRVRSASRRGALQPRGGAARQGRDPLGRARYAGRGVRQAARRAMELPDAAEAKYNSQGHDTEKHAARVERHHDSSRSLFVSSSLAARHHAFNRHARGSRREGTRSRCPQAHGARAWWVSARAGLSRHRRTTSSRAYRARRAADSGGDQPARHARRALPAACDQHQVARRDALCEQGLAVVARRAHGDARFACERRWKDRLSSIRLDTRSHRRASRVQRSSLARSEALRPPVAETSAI